MTKSIMRGVQSGMKIGLEEAFESIDWSWLEPTSKAINHIINEQQSSQ